MEDWDLRMRDGPWARTYVSAAESANSCGRILTIVVCYCGVASREWDRES